MDLRIINFPDKIFKKYLIEHFDKDGDNEISLTEALSIEKINCSQLGINSLAGIEYFPNLILLDCSKNNLENLDISKNKELEYLNCRGNHKLNSLDLSDNLLLNTLYCGACNLKSLDVHKNTKLSILSCYFNQINQIDLSENINLTTLRIRRCELDELSLTGLTELKVLDCSENGIQQLYLSDCTELEYLNCYENDLYDDLNLSKLIRLKELICNRNPNLYSITISDGQNIENIHSDITPTTIEYRNYLTWKAYKEEQDYESWDEQDDRTDWINDAFDGDPDAYWNID